VKRQDITIVPDPRVDSIVTEFSTFAEQHDETADIAACGAVHHTSEEMAGP
jgi:hypothetical protein